MSHQFYQTAPRSAPPRPPPPPPGGFNKKKSDASASSSYYGQANPFPVSSHPPSGSSSYYSNVNERAKPIQPTTSTNASNVPMSGGNEWFSNSSSTDPSARSPAAFGSTGSLESQSNSYSASFYNSSLSSAPVNNSASNFIQPTIMNPNIPSSNSADINNLSGPMTSNTNHLKSSSSSGYNPDDFANEPSLMEELEINIPHILQKSRAVILPSSRIFGSYIDPNLMDDDDLIGPLAYALLLGSELLLTAKIYLGYIYGFGMFGCVAMALMLNLMCPPDQKSIPVWSVISILGYSLLPVNLLAFLNIFLRVKNWGGVGMAFGLLTILWCTVASTRLFERGWGLRDQRYLVAYPTALLYSCFVLITIF